MLRRDTISRTRRGNLPTVTTHISTGASLGPVSELLGGAGETLDRTFESFETPLHVTAKEGGQRGGDGRRMETILLRGVHLGEVFQPARHRQQFQRTRRRWAPGLERQTCGVLGEHRGVQAIGLAALHHRLREVAHGARISHHQRHARRLQRQSQIQTVEAGGFQADAHRSARALEPAEQGLMPRRCVRELAHRVGLPRPTPLHHERARADFNTARIKIHGLVHGNLLE